MFSSKGINKRLCYTSWAILCLHSHIVACLLNANIIISWPRDLSIISCHWKQKITTSHQCTLKMCECTCGLWEFLYFDKAAFLFIMPNVIAKYIIWVYRWLIGLSQMIHPNDESFPFWLSVGPSNGVQTRVAFFFLKGDSLLVLILMEWKVGLQCCAYL